MTASLETSPAASIGLAIKQTQALLHQRMDEALRPLGLSVPQYVCLLNLHEDPGITSSELARRAFVSRQSMNVLLQGLERRGLVERSEEPGPRRERAAALTVSARRLVPQAHAAVDEVVDHMVRGLSSRTQDALLEALDSCREELGR